MLRRFARMPQKYLSMGVEGETAALIEPYDSHAGGMDIYI